MTSKLLSLGLLQGLTEFLPVSSSGHLAIFQNLAGFDSPPLGFDLALHGATLLATLLFFRKNWWGVLAEWMSGWKLSQEKRGPGWKTGWAILGGTVVTAAIGLPLKSAVESAMESLSVVGCLLLVNAGILFLSGRLAGRAKGKQVNLPVGLGVGFAQGLAVFPGISRSGSTICSGLSLGLSPAEAFDFSFLMSLPSVAGAILLEVLDFGGTTNFLDSLPAGWWQGAVAAFISGLCALAVLRRFVVRGKWNGFAVYSAVVGLCAVGAGLSGRF
jgi:undecaprenyl-diphosphatase